jgi:hypothetical protein
MPRLPRAAGVCLCLCWLTPVLLADEPTSKDKPRVEKSKAPQFLRVERDKKGEPLTLQTATVRYRPASGEGELVVDLIGVVHIGEKSYYERLNGQFEQYDVLLYELVAPEGTRVPKGGKGRGDNPVGMLQGMMKSALELDSQLEHVDYTKKNFVHADLSPDQMAAAVRKRGDDGLTIFLRVMADMMQQQNLVEQKRAKDGAKEGPEIDLLGLLFDPDRGLKLKRLLAQQFEDLDGVGGGLGSTLNTILVADRNEAAMKVLQKEMAKGRKKIGIFYGAAHMPDFDKRLRADFGLKPEKEEWLTAWDLKPKKKGLNNLLEQLMK